MSAFEVIVCVVVGGLVIKAYLDHRANKAKPRAIIETTPAPTERHKDDLR